MSLHLPLSFQPQRLSGNCRFECSCENQKCFGCLTHSSQTSNMHAETWASKHARHPLNVIFDGLQACCSQGRNRDQDQDSVSAWPSDAVALTILSTILPSFQSEFELTEQTRVEPGCNTQTSSNRKCSVSFISDCSAPSLCTWQREVFCSLTSKPTASGGE